VKTRTAEISASGIAMDSVVTWPWHSRRGNFGVSVLLLYRTLYAVRSALLSLVHTGNKLWSLGPAIFCRRRLNVAGQQFITRTRRQFVASADEPLATARLLVRSLYRAAWKSKIAPFTELSRIVQWQVLKVKLRQFISDSLCGLLEWRFICLSFRGFTRLGRNQRTSSSGSRLISSGLFTYLFRTFRWLKTSKHSIKTFRQLQILFDR